MGAETAQIIKLTANFLKFETLILVSPVLNFEGRFVRPHFNTRKGIGKELISAQNSLDRNRGNQPEPGVFDQKPVFSMG
jgi:hypothetical protein